MAITFSTAILKIITDAVADAADAGSSAPTIELQSAADAVLAIVSLDGTAAFGSATTADPSVAQATGLPATPIAFVGTEAAGAGTACTKFQQKDGNGTVIWSGTVTVTGGGGDLTLDNTSIAEDQNGTITSYTLSAGN